MRIWDGLYWHNVDIKFLQSQSSGSGVEIFGQTDRWSERQAVANCVKNAKQKYFIISIQ
jgi:hypothetical protein